jgi:hypothetical protein
MLIVFITHLSDKINLKFLDDPGLLFPLFFEYFLNYRVARDSTSSLLTTLCLEKPMVILLWLKQFK